MLISHSARSACVIGLPRRGPSASATLAPSASPATPAMTASLGIDMLDLPLGLDRPTGDGVEMVARKTADRRGFRGLAAHSHEMLEGRLIVAVLVPGPAWPTSTPAV